MNQITRYSDYFGRTHRHRHLWDSRRSQVFCGPGKLTYFRVWIHPSFLLSNMPVCTKLWMTSKAGKYGDGRDPTAATEATEGSLLTPAASQEEEMGMALLGCWGWAPAGLKPKLFCVLLNFNSQAVRCVFWEQHRIVIPDIQSSSEPHIGPEKPRRGRQLF